MLPLSTSVVGDNTDQDTLQHVALRYWQHHTSYVVGDPRVVEHSFSGGGLAGINVCDYAHISDSLKARVQQEFDQL